MLSTTPILATRDVVATLKFYCDVLGFESSWTWGVPVSFGSASIGSVSVMFNRAPDLAARVGGHQLWFTVQDVDVWYARHIENGAKLVAEIEDKPWGMREYVVEDPSGYHLRFAEMAGERVQRSKPMPTDVAIHRSLPTFEEYDALAGATFYQGKADPEALAKSWNGVVARDASGRAIGMVRIVNDAPGWYGVWDVAVRQEWRGRSIGRKLMDEAIAMIKEASPGAWIFLFTYKHEFYAKLGFEKGSVTMRRA